MSLHSMGRRLALAIVGCILLSSLSTASATGKTGRITVYWGQTSSEGSLREACESKLYSTVILSFLNNFGGGIGKYSLASKADAKGVAKHLWNYYLGGKSRNRPFGNAVLDGVDFDIELGSRAHYDDLARYLKAYGKKKVFITAAPQCPFPDRMLGEALRTGLFDRVHVQFYNNPVCSYRAGNVAAFKKAWKDWTKSLPNSSVYLGLPAARGASNKGSGYVDPGTLVSKVLPIVQRSNNYGGIMLWSRYFDVNSGYSRRVKKFV